MSGWDGKGLVDTAWLAEHLNDPDLRIYDATVHLKPATPGPYEVISGRSDYEVGHIPGAGFLDLIEDLSDTGTGLHFSMPSADRLAKAFGAAGVGDGNRVVVYSSTTPMWATRVWWMLRSMGFDDAAVLDGGLAKWRAEGRPLSTEPARYPPANPTLRPRPEMWADKNQVLSAIGDGDVCTINALPRSVHSGEAPTNYGRKGHIKGSLNVPYGALLKEDGTYQDDSELQQLFAGSGVLERPKVIFYCGGGISATMDALALSRLGHKSIAVYDGSMSEWSRDPSLPMETGA